jgi:hypothetical protein
VFRHLAGEQGQQEDFPTTFLAAYSLSTSLQRRHAEAGGCLPATLDNELAAGHLLAVCLEEQRLVQAPASSSSEMAGQNRHSSLKDKTTSSSQPPDKFNLHKLHNIHRWQKVNFALVAFRDGSCRQEELQCDGLRFSFLPPLVCR